VIDSASPIFFRSLLHVAARSTAQVLVKRIRRATSSDGNASSIGYCGRFQKGADYSGSTGTMATVVMTQCGIHLPGLTIGHIGSSSRMGFLVCHDDGEMVEGTWR